MRQTPLLLVGGRLGIAPGPQSPHSSALIRIALVVWLIVGIGFLVYKVLTPRSKPVEAATLPSNPPVRPPVLGVTTEEVLQRITTVEERLTTTTVNLRRAEDQMARLLPSLERNYLWVEKNRLETAMTMTDVARRDAEASRWELDVFLNLLRKEHDSK